MLVARQEKRVNGNAILNGIENGPPAPVPMNDLSLPAARPLPSADALRDPRGRALRDLRISVTDRCNFRCTYCMPRAIFDDDHRFMARAELLSFEEILRLARLFAGLGVTKIRLTGGEPLLRRGIERLVAGLAEIPGMDLAMTTNGSLLRKKAAALRAAGLQRLTVSLDAIDETVFRTMSDADYSAAQVLDGIAAAEEAGFASVKVNMVVKRGANDGEVLALARRFRHTPHIVRFIEYMDVGASNGWKMDEVLPSAEVLRRIGAEFPLEPLEPNVRGEVAQRWRYRDGGGEIGVISSVTRAFCSDCSRLRLSTEGRLYTCLFATAGYDLRTPLRGGEDDRSLRQRVEGLWTMRQDRYSEVRTSNTAGLRDGRIEMSYIGG